MPTKKRAPMPDIMGDVLTPTSRPVEQATPRLIENSTHREIEASSYRRMAFDLSSEVAAALELAYSQARATATGDRRKVSRSAIVERALRVALGLSIGVSHDKGEH